MNLRGSSRALYFLTAVLAVVAGVGRVGAQGPDDLLPLGSRIRIEAGSEITRLDRQTGRLISEAEILLTNVGDRPVRPPFVVVVELEAPEGVETVQVAGAQGGVGVAPWQWPWLNLSLSGATNLPPGGSLPFNLSLSRPAGVTPLYRLVPYGLFNRDPIAVLDGPILATVGEPVGFSGGRSSDPDGDPLAYEWQFGDGAAAQGEEATKVFERSGTVTVKLTVQDPENASDTAQTLVTVVPPGAFALARTRALAADGQPLGGVGIEENGPDGLRTFAPTDDSGFAALGGVPGEYRWKFSADGFLPVWRRATLENGEFAFVPSPWLTPLAADPVELSPLFERLLRTADGGVLISVAPNAVSAPATARLTPVGPQALPYPLPLGWSPLSSWHVTFGVAGALLEPANATLALERAPRADAALWVVRFDPETLAWLAQGPAMQNGTTVQLTVAADGVYALVVPDLAPTEPPPPVAGMALSGFVETEPADLAGLVAATTLEPEVGLASVRAEDVLASVFIRFEAQAAVPSGRFLRAALDERYQLGDGTTLRGTPYDTSFFVYRGGGTGPASRVDAEFPLRPGFLFGPDVLAEATVTARVLAPEAFSGALIGPDGGSAALPGFRLDAGAGDFPTGGLIELRTLDVEALGGLTGDLEAVVAFDLNLSGLGGAQRLTFASADLPPNGFFVLARLLATPGGRGVVPVERLVTGANGQAASLEPVGEPRLPGLDRSGRYVLVRVAAAVGLVDGTGRDAEGTPALGLLARIVGTPWVALTGPGGGFRLVAAPGAGVATLFNPATEDAGETAFALADASDVVVVEVTLDGAGPSVAEVTPADGAIKVPTVTAVRVRFSKRLDAASFGPDAVELRDAGDQVVTASLSLNLAGDVAELLPVNPLAPSSVHRIFVAATLRDRTGRALVGDREFTFTTAAPASRAAAGLTIYEPGATNLPTELLDRLVGYAPGQDESMVVAEGGPGTSDPRVPVILVNLDSGETATVLSGADGSFAGFLRARVDDYIQAVFVNGNGTRIAVDATRQKFDDGGIGLFAQGGLLDVETDEGMIEVEVGPGAVPERAVFKLVPMTLEEALDAVDGTEPEGGKIVAALRIELRGTLNEADSAVSLPFDPSILEIPPGETAENGAFALCLVERIDGNFVYRVVDEMRYENGRLATASPPFSGWIGGLAGLDPSGAAAMLYGVHLNFGPHRITGKTLICGESFDGCLQDNRVLPGAIVRAFQQAPTRSLGGFPPGAVFSSTGADGRYALVVSGNPNQYSVVATHPRFEPARVLYVNIGVGALVSRWDFGFNKLAQIAAPPSLTVTHRPVFPSPGEPVIVDVRATSPDGAAPGINFSVARVRSLVPGVPASADQVTVEQLPEGSSGPGFAQRSWRLSSTNALQVTLDIVAAENASVRREHIVSFSGPPPLATDNPPPADPGDRQGPQVVASFPASGEFVVPGEAIELFFNEPVDRAVLAAGELIRLYAGFDVRAATSGGPVPGQPILTLSADQRRLTIRFPQLVAGRRYTLVVPPTAVRDLRGNPLDQNPATVGADPFTAFLTAAEQQTATLPDLELGGGALIKGSILIALERSGNGGIKSYDISDPTSPTLIHQVMLPSPPRAALLIPGYSFFLQTSNRIPVRRDLLVVAGGRVGAGFQGDDLVRGAAYLRVYDVTGPEVGAGPPEQPRFMNFLAGTLINQIDSIVAKLVWSAPNLYYLEHWSEVNSEGFALTGQQIGAVNLQEFISALNVSRDEQSQFPLVRVPGIDLNGDGDYTDPGEVAPLPSRLPDGFYGKVASYDLNDFDTTPAFLTDQRILDFDFRGGLLAVTVERGLQRDPTGQPGGEPLAAGYRSLSLGGSQLRQRDALLPLEGAFPKRLVLLPAAAYRIPPDLGGFGAAAVQTLALAVVSLSPDAEGRQSLGMIDVTDPVSPRLLRMVPFPPNFPDERGSGFMQSLFWREDGMLELATTLHRVLLDPAQLLQPPPADEGALHPAFIGVFANSGSGNLMDGSSSSGVRAVAALGDGQVYQDAPRLRFVGFPSQPVVVDPNSFAGDENALANLFRGMTEPGVLVPARVRSEGFVSSTLNPASPLVHYHLLLDAPGGAGPVVLLGLESLDDHGQPLPPGGLGFPPFRAMLPETLASLGLGNIDCGLPVTPVVAYRLSDNPLSPWFNRYLSVPLAFIYERLQPAEWAELREQLDRQILGSGSFVRAFIEPVMEAAGPLRPFAAVVDSRRKAIAPVTRATVRALPALYTMGANPPPAGGHVELPGTAGNVAAHSGEFRHETVDVELPSRRMSIAFKRTVGGQDLYQGPFGPGWDFNYNQRLLRLDPILFPPGLKLPLVVRATEADSAIAESGDVLFQSGEGRVTLFKDAGDSPPDGIAADPLVAHLGWFGRAERYYLPEPGVFEVLIRFADGKYGRLTPDGTQYWYDARGRLNRIVDRYDGNWHELIYTADGRLRKIVDHSIPGEERFLELGYYLEAGDTFAEFFSGLDQRTSNTRWRNQIAGLRDYTGREVLFEYDAPGRLHQRRGPQVAAPAAEGFSGRATTTYNVNSCGEIIGIVAGGSGAEAGAAEFAAETATRSDGTLVVRGGIGVSGSVNANIATENSAASVEDSVAAVTTATGDRTDYVFDARGYPKRITSSGPNAPPSEFEIRHNRHGQLEFIRHPEGNSVTITYDEDHPVLRARGNAGQMVRDPGPLGGGVITSTHNFDAWYGQKSGAQEDEGGFTHTYELQDDRREVFRILHGEAGFTERRYNEQGQRIFEETPDGKVQRWLYDESTGFLEQEERGDFVLRHFYDGSRAGRLGMVTRTEAPLGAAIERRYDDRLLVTEETRGDWFRRVAYDENANPVRIETALEAGASVVETRRYNRNGFLLETTIAGVETEGSPAALTTRYTPDALNRIHIVTRPGLETETFTYDHEGRVVRRVLGEFAEEFDYDRNGRLRVQRQGGAEVLRRSYDGHGRMIAAVRPDGRDGDISEAFTYFGRGEVRMRTLADAEYGVGRELETLAVDALGRAVEVRRAGTTIAPITTTSYLQDVGLLVTYAGPRETETQRFDATGRLREKTDSQQALTQSFDSGGRLERRQSQESGFDYWHEFDYNELDQVVELRDGVGRIATYAPRFDGRIRSVSNGRGHISTATYTKLGEPLTATRPSGVGYRYAYDRNRQSTFVGESAGPPAGDQFAYDNTLRQVSVRRRDGGQTRYENFDGRNHANTVGFPGGTMTLTHDRLGRVTTLANEYQGGRNYQAQFRYDALHRPRLIEFGAAAEHRFAYNFDRAGPLLSATLTLAGEDYTTETELYADGHRRSLRYPSGSLVAEDRQPSGRLAGVTDEAGTVLAIESFAGVAQPRVLNYGTGLGAQPALRRENVYDPRRRLTATRYVHPASGRTVAELRYQYDAADNPVARQWMHRSGRTDFFGFDNDERLASAHYAARPAQPGDSGARVLPGITPARDGFATGAFGRSYGFDGGGRDLLVSAPLVNPDGAPAYPFAATLGSHDEFLFARSLDGAARPAPDPLGNTAGTTLRVRPDSPGVTGPVAMPAQLFYDGFSRLARVVRDDGVAIDYEYAPDGLMVRKRATAAAGTQLISDRTFVWQERRLLEEWETVPVGRTLVARYYYADGDNPVAADLRDDGGALARVYYVVDAQGSVIGLADEEGEVFERVTYDVFGQPRIEARDDAAPEVAYVRRHASGFLIVFTEPVLPRLLPSFDPEGLVTGTESLGTAISVVGIAGSVSLAEDVAGIPYGHAIWFQGPIAEGAAVEVRVDGGRLEDEWGNAVAAVVLNFNYTGPVGGELFNSGAPVGSTTVSLRARSAAGNAMLFHGQWYDYDAGLLYLRTRHYDPYTGSFLQRDPNSYEDSVNPYAAFAYNPLRYRDPNGDAIPLIALGIALIKAAVAVYDIVDAVKEVKKASLDDPASVGKAGLQVMSAVASVASLPGVGTAVAKAVSWAARTGKGGKLTAGLAGRAEKSLDAARAAQRATHQAAVRSAQADLRLAGATRSVARQAGGLAAATDEVARAAKRAQEASAMLAQYDRMAKASREVARAQHVFQQAHQTVEGTFKTLERSVAAAKVLNEWQAAAAAAGGVSTAVTPAETAKAALGLLGRKYGHRTKLGGWVIDVGDAGEGLTGMIELGEKFVRDFVRSDESDPEPLQVPVAPHPH